MTAHGQLLPAAMNQEDDRLAAPDWRRPESRMGLWMNHVAHMPLCSPPCACIL